MAIENFLEQRIGMKMVCIDSQEALLVHSANQLVVKLHSEAYMTVDLSASDRQWQR